MTYLFYFKNAKRNRVVVICMYVSSPRNDIRKSENLFLLSVFGLDISGQLTRAGELNELRSSKSKHRFIATFLS